MSTTKNARGVAASACMAIAVIAAWPFAATAQIEEVVVTTRKREESLQDVPIAVSAITAEQIERQGISDLRDVVANQPSVQFDQSFGPADNRITIRGLSNTRGRSNVAFLVDGVDVTTETLISAGSGLLANRRLLNDVERIEIVKGPQSALYGRAAFAGAISYITKEPGDELDGKVGLDVGDYGRRTIDAAIGGPLTDTLGLRLTGTRWNEDGFYTNSVSGNDVGGTDGYGLAVTTVWKPADPVKVKARMEYSEEHSDPRAVANIKGTTQFDIPDSAKAIARPIIARDPLTGALKPSLQPTSSSGTNLFNFGPYCPGRDGFDPSAINATQLGAGNNAAFCLPRLISDKKGLVVAESENPLTGQDYPGTDLETFRTSLVASVDVGFGTFTSNTGWTDSDSRDLYDQDYQAVSRPDTLLSDNQSNQENSTHQLSQELRFETQLAGPFRVTAGGLYWNEHRSLQDRNFIISCAPYGRIGATLLKDENNNNIVTFNGSQLLDPTTGTLAYVRGLCDGNPAANDNNTLGPTNTSWQYYARQIQQPQFASTWDARTKHWSFYGALEWTITDDFKATFEDRLVNEDFHLSKPGNSSCTEIAFAQGNNPTAPWVKGDLNGSTRTYCDVERALLNINPPLDAATGQLAWRQIEGSTYSHFNTPKLTLDWTPVDGTKIYFSWAFAQKPGGINQLAGGGGAAPPTIADERFEPEKMRAWELGIKTGFEYAGFWQVNASGFYQDYTDKQVGIQIIGPTGVSQPRVVNAAGAEVWGFEFETLWQPAFMEGLAFSLSGTLLDATYTDWVDDSRNLVKAAAYGSCPLVWKANINGQEVETTDPTNYAITGYVQQASPYKGAAVFCRFDYSGNELERTPKQSYAASVSLQRPFLATPFQYLVEVSGNYQGKRWLDPENLVQVDEHALMDIRLGLTSDKWDVIAYVNNVLDDDTIKTAGSGPDFGEQVTQLGFTAGFGTTHYFATLPDPRVFGIRAAYRFGPGR